MPLSSWFALHWYGPGMASAVDVSSPSANLNMSGVARMSVEHTATPVASLGLVATRTMSLIDTAAPTAFVNMKGVGRMSLIGTIGELSQDDVTGAVLEAKVEGDLSLKQAVRLLLAHASGDATGLDGSAITFKSLDGATTRIAGTITAGNRTITTIDGT